MLSRLIYPAILTGLYFGLNLIIYKRLKSWFSNKPYWRIIRLIYFVSISIVLGGLIQMSIRFLDPPINPSVLANWFIGFSFSIMVGKLLYGIILIIDSLFGLPWTLFQKLKGKTHEPSKGRRNFVKTTSVVVAGLPFLSLIQGITFGKYDYQVRKVVLKFPDLPKAFHGFKIAQISDIHSGSFDSISEVKKGVELVNQQGADLIAFTGDLVNARTKEIKPFLNVFNKLKAPHGVMSTKGNHDYGLYYKWPSEEAHQQDQLDMEEAHRALGFDLLNNTNRIIEKDGEQISVVGVENWGKTPFPQIGDIDAALKGTEKTPFTVLLSHDPSHWEQVVIDHKKHVHLTLSGHTHGMQFGVEIPGFLKWSPVQYRYPRWAGLYTEKNQHLYVNRGFGFIGFPGRVGIRPEITVFELQVEA